VKKFLLIFTLLVAVTVISIQFLSFNGLKPGLASRLSKISGYNADITGNIGIRLLPQPKIVLEKVNISSTDKQILNADSISLIPSLTDLLTGKMRITGIEIYGGDIKFENFREQVKTVSDISYVRITKSRLQLSDSLLIGKTFDDFNGTLSISSLSKTLALDAQYKVGDYAFVLATSFQNLDADGNSENANIVYGSSLFKIAFNGKIKSLYTNPDFSGTAKLNLNQLLGSDNYWDDFINGLIKDENLEIKGDASINNKKIQISNITVESKSVQSGTANFVAVLGKESDISFDTSIKQINLDTLLGKNSESSNGIEPFLKKLLESFNVNLSEDLTGNFRVAIDAITYNGDSISNFIMEADAIDGELFLSEFNAKMPGDMTLDVTGILNHNEIRPKFAGNISIDVKNLKAFSNWLKISSMTEKIDSNSFALQSAFSLIPRNLKFYDIKSIIGNMMISGKYMVKHSGEQRLNTRLALRVNELDLDQYKIPSEIDNIIFNLYLFDNDKTGSFFLDYTKDFIWLRTVPINLNLELLVDKALYKAAEFDNLQVNLRLSPANLAIDRIAVSNPSVDFEGTAELSLTAFNPKIQTNITFNKLDTRYTSQLFPDLAHLKSYQTDYFATYAKNAKDQSVPVENYLSSDFNFFSSHNFIGNIKVDIKDLTTENLVAQNVGLDLDILEGALNLNSLSATMFNGALNIIGNINNASIVPAFNFTFGYNNFYPEDFLNYLFGLKFMRGYASISGAVTAAGKDYPTFFNKLDGSIRVLGKKIAIKGFDLAELIRLTDVSLTPAKQTEIISTYSRQGESLFEDLRGSINIKSGIATMPQFVFTSNRAQGIYAANMDIYNLLVSGVGRISFIPVGDNHPIILDFLNKGNITAQEFHLNTTKLSDYLKTNTQNTTPAKQPQYLRN